jgi:hypothetical protein
MEVLRITIHVIVLSTTMSIHGKSDLTHLIILMYAQTKIVVYPQMTVE